MTLDGIVLQVNIRSLLVREIATGNEILVHTQNWRRFSRGDCVRIIHNGRMTHSIPPQITAISIQPCTPGRPPMPPVPPGPPMPPRPSEMRASVIERRRDGLLVMDLSNNRQTFVRTPHANHFCPRQRVTVTYDSIRMNNPPEIDAIDITALC